jgi:hypothetical protein
MIGTNRHRLLLCKIYTDALAQANVVNPPLAAEFDLGDKPGDNVNDL